MLQCDVFIYLRDLYPVITITDLITLLSIYLLGNLHLSQSVGGIMLSQWKEIHLIRYGQGILS
jgi:hypothetical protein